MCTSSARRLELSENRAGKSFKLFCLDIFASAQAGLLPVVVGAHSGAFNLVPKEAPEDAS